MTDANDVLKSGGSITREPMPANGATQDDPPSHDEPPPGRFDDDDRRESEEKIVRVSFGPADYLRAWANEGKLPRLATGFETIDDACRGGLAFPWRVVIVGAPHAGKTFLAMMLARRLLAHGNVFCGWLGVDEEPEDLQVRLAQMAGYSVEDCENRDAGVLETIARELESLPMRLYGPDWTIESAAADMAERAPANSLRLFVVDSAQTARSELANQGDGARDLVEANARAIRRVAAQHRALTLVTSEANRNQYGNVKAAAQANRMASGAESRAIEYMAQTLFYVGTPRDLSDVIEADSPKNRRGKRSAFKVWFRMQRERHTLEEIDDPTTPDDVTDDEAIERLHAEDKSNAEFVARIIGENAGIGASALRDRVRLATQKTKRKLGKDAVARLVKLAEKLGLVVDHPRTVRTKAGTQTNHAYYAAAVTVTDCDCDRCSAQAVLPAIGVSP